MGSFAANESTALDGSEQTDLALWAAAAGVIAMSLDPEAKDFADPAFGHELYRLREPPPGTDIWLGANNHGEMGWLRSHSIKRDALPTENPGQAWGVILSLGHAVFYVAHHGLPEHRLRLKHHANRALRTIWHHRGPTIWPTKLRINSSDMSPLAEEVAQHSTWERRA
ncbi:MAG: hypothetical protein EON56_04925 [Alphaproteobacteria bacterium]|nr:MAG: hypothetical protein EON56_04925 [Alphaproteobacteria bacterium]